MMMLPLQWLLMKSCLMTMSFILYALLLLGVLLRADLATIIKLTVAATWALFLFQCCNAKMGLDHYPQEMYM